MTLTEIQQLSDFELRLLIARRLGWSEIRETAAYLYARRPCAPTVVEEVVVRLPNFPLSLDSCREMEASLSFVEAQRYEKELARIVALNVKNVEKDPEGRVADLFFWHATARMKCEAFVLAIG